MEAATLYTEITAKGVMVRIPRDTTFLRLVRLAVVQVATQAGFRGDDVDKLELAVDEACSNAMVHGDQPADLDEQTDPGYMGFEPALPGEIEVSMRYDRHKLSITICEPGRPFPFDLHGNFDLEEHLSAFNSGGLGIYIIKSFMDEVHYNHHPTAGNELTIVKYITSDTCPSSSHST